MRPAPASLVAAQYALHIRPSPDSRLDWAHAIEEIGQYTHPSIAMTLAPLTLVSDPMIANTALRVLDKFMSRLDAQGILWIARAGRGFHSGGGTFHELWHRLQPHDVKKLEGLGESAIGLLCIGSVHASGYVRQACVEILAKHRGRLPLAFLLVRINDWVRPVRGAARLAVMGRLLEARKGDLQRAEEIFENLILAECIEQWNRDDHRAIRDAIQATLRSATFAVVRERGLRDKRSALQLRMHKLTLEQNTDAPLETLRNALASRNGAVRIWAAREATKCLVGDELRGAVDIMLRDALAIVRYEAVFALATKLPPLNTATLVPLLHDIGPDVRFLAAYYLEKNHFDIRRHYLEALPNATIADLPAIVTGIGERGKSGDETSVVTFLTHSDPHVRRAVVFTLGKLRRDGEMSWLFEALRDPHKMVVREAARQIEARIHVADAQVMEKWLQSDSRLSMRRDAVRIGAKMERWEALGFLLRAALIDDLAIRRDVERELSRWFQRFIDWYSPPDKVRLVRLEELTEMTHGALDERWIQRIRDKLAEQKKR